MSKKMKDQIKKEEVLVIEDILIDPCKFFSFIRKHEPYTYQKVFLKDKSKRIAVRSGRQVGKTVMGSVKALYRAFMNPHEQILILAPSQRQSNIFFWNIKEMVGENPFISDCVRRNTASQIYFDNGSEIHCLPASSKRVSERIRGFSPTLIIFDEAAYIPDEVLTAVEPSLAATDGDVILMSTPYGKRGFFWHAFRPGSGYSVHHVKSEDCPNITKEFLEDKRKRITKNDYIQEYCGEFTEEGDTFFTRELILKCVQDLADIDRPVTNEVYHLGVDCARFGEDETVYTIVQKGEIINVVKIIATSKKPSTDIIGRIKELHKLWNFECIHIDSTSMGGTVYDILLQEGYPIFPAKFSSIKFKEQLFRNLKTLMEHDRIILPNNEKLINQMGNLVMRFTSQGMSLQPPERGHDDYCFVAGTKILTNKGQIPIEQLKIGNKVMTRDGYKKIIEIGMRKENVIEKFGLIGTGDHPIITTKGIKKLKNLDVTDKIYTWNEKQSCIEVKTIIDIQNPNEDNLEYITGNMTNGNHLQKRRVYNISVEECPEYFANNILVHNCVSLAIAVRSFSVNNSEEEESLYIR